MFDVDFFHIAKGASDREPQTPKFVMDARCVVKFDPYNSSAKFFLYFDKLFISHAGNVSILAIWK